MADVVANQPADLTTVQKEDGPWWRLTTTCSGCQVTMHLDSKEKPDYIALGIGRTEVQCEECIDKAEAAEARADQAATLRKNLEFSGLPNELQGLYFNEMIPEEGRRFVIEQIRHWTEYARPEKAAIYLYGIYGCGKTRLAGTAAYARIGQWPLRYVSVPILLAQLTAAFNDSARKTALSVLIGKGGLVLDDLDKESPSVWAKQQLFAAIDSRLQSGAPLLITGNVRPDRLREKFGEDELGLAIESRINGMEVLELPGRDNRIKMEGI